MLASPPDTSPYHPEPYLWLPGVSPEPGRAAGEASGWHHSGAPHVSLHPGNLQESHFSPKKSWGSFPTSLSPGWPHPSSPQGTRIPLRLLPWGHRPKTPALLRTKGTRNLGAPSKNRWGCHVYFYMRESSFLCLPVALGMGCGAGRGALRGPAWKSCPSGPRASPRPPVGGKRAGAAPANNGQETPAGLGAGEWQTHVLPAAAHSDWGPPPFC